ncbi:MAG: phosphohistidine phosphatase SixA [Spirochaetota bacterium]
MNAYLVQHGEARPKEQDPERSLTEKGLSEVKKTASFIARYKKAKIDYIVHSGKKRALQTAEAFAEALAPPGGVRQEKELEPLSTPWGWVERLADTEENVTMVGHLPHLKRLATLLLCQDESKQVIEFHYGCVVCLFKNESGIWTLQWMVIPDLVP